MVTEMSTSQQLKYDAAWPCLTQFDVSMMLSQNNVGTLDVVFIKYLVFPHEVFAVPLLCYFQTLERFYYVTSNPGNAKYTKIQSNLS